MNEQTIQAETQINTHSHKVLYTSLGLLLGSVVMLLIVVGVFYGKSKTANPVPEQKETQSQAEQSVNIASDDQLQDSVTPMPIATTQDLNTQLNSLDNTDIESISVGLEQNSADASQFSQ